MQSTQQEIAALKSEIRNLKKALANLIVWLPQSANGPIRWDEAEYLLKLLEGTD
jgi:hypothetical protein